MTSGLLTRKTLRELRSAGGQTLALVALVGLGVAVFIAAIGAYQDLATSEATTYQRLRLAAAWFRLDATPQRIGDETSVRPGISAVQGRLVVDTGLQVGSDRVRARLIGTQVAQAATVNDVAIISGRRPDRPRDVMLERTFAERRGISAGDGVTVLLGGQPVALRVTATVSSPEYLQVTPDRYEFLPAPSSFAVMFIDRSQLQQLTGASGRINDLVVRLDEGAPPQTLDGLEADLRRSGVLLEATRRADQASYAALEQDLASFRAIAVAMPTIILLAGMAAMTVMLGRVVRAQRPLIGVTKALGYTDATVLRHYLTHAGIIGVTGSAVGVIAGTVLGGAVTRAYTGEIGVPFTTARFHPGLAIVASSVALGAVTIAAWWPARRSARLAPALATRIDPTSGHRPGSRASLERLLPLPLAARLPLRTALRARGRAAATAAGIGAAIVLILMVLGLRDAVSLFIDKTFDDVERWDVAVTLDQPTDPASVTAMATAAGAAEASPYLQTPAGIEAHGRRKDVLLTAIAADQTLRRLRLGDGIQPAAALRDGGIVLTTGLADDLGVDVGASVTATTPAGPARLAVSAISDEPIPARAYIGLDTAARLAGTPLANGAHLRVAGDTGIVRSRLYDQPGVASVAIRDEQRDDLRSLLSVFNALITVMLTFAVAMAFAVLFNAMTVNVIEREREYATMRAVGAPPALIGRLLATEATLLWAVALIPGLLVGTWLASRLGDAVAADVFTLQTRATPASYFLAGGGVLAIALGSLLLPLRRIRHLDLAEATKTLG